MTSQKLYHVWVGMKQRCFDTNASNYKNYGGRGITIYEPWLDNPKDFFDFVSQLPHYGEEGYTLDRIDNNGNYEPGNLRWATRKEQSRNTRRNHLVEYEGQLMTLAEASEKSGLSVGTLRGRLNRGLKGSPLFLLPT